MNKFYNKKTSLIQYVFRNIGTQVEKELKAKVK